MSNDKEPLLSVITVCFNPGRLIDKTLESIKRQHKRGKIEYIIVDGKSSDGTGVNLKNRYEDVDLLIIEEDNGIYDAMNKGLRMATGKYALFLNAGDYLAHDDIISSLDTSADIYYSDTILVNDQDTPLGLRSELTTRHLPLDGLSKDSFLQGLVVSHQSIVVKKEIAPTYIMNNLSADIDWVIKCVDAAMTITFLKDPISCFLVGGISDQKKLTSLKDRFKIMVSHFGLGKTLTQHIYFFIRYFSMKPFIK